MANKSASTSLSTVQQNHSQYQNDLEKCGIATSNNLRELLITCPDPVEAIRHFQMMNSVQLPSLKPVMKLLDLHGIRRSEYHETVISELTERMVARLHDLGQKQSPENVHRLEQHLERCFRLYRVPRIRPIVLETLAQLPKVSDRYLKLIICDKELYDQCAVTVRQQIWVKNESLFLESIEPVLDSYIYEKERQLLTIGASASSSNDPESEKDKPQTAPPPPPVTNFFNSDSAKSRRQKRQVQELISMVGNREQLYCRLVNLIRERFLATKNMHYCSLRFNILMAAHDANLDFLTRVDACHDFAWCLDACSKHLRTKHLDSQQLTKLKALLDTGTGNAATGKKVQQQQPSNKPIPEMAMIAGCPHILHLFASFAVKMLRDNAAGAVHLPREMPSLQLLIKILQMGLNAAKLLLGEITFEQLLEQQQSELSTVFLAAFSSMLCQDAIRAELVAAPDEVADRFAEDRQLRPRHPSVDRFLRDHPLCSLLWLHHLTLGDVACPLSASKRRTFEPANALRYAEPLVQALSTLKMMAINDPWVQLLSHKLLQCPAVFGNEQLATLFIRRFFLQHLKKIPSAKFHLLRLCVQHRMLIPGELLVTAINALVKCAAAADDLQHPGDLEEGQHVTTIGNFGGEFSKHRETLMEAKQLRAAEIGEKEEEKTEEPEEGELLDDEEEREEEAERSSSLVFGGGLLL